MKASISPNPGRPSAVILAVLLVVASCGSGEDSAADAGLDASEGATEQPSEARRSEWGPLAVVSPGQGSDEALIGGVIGIANGCVVLDEKGEDVLVVWPSDRTRWDDPTSVISFELADGSVVELRDGMSVSLTGGGNSVAEGGLSADEFLASVEWVAEPKSSCVGDTRWFVGDGVTIEPDEPAAGDAPETGGPAELVEPECEDDGSCAAGFVLTDVFYALSCVAVRESSVTATVIGAGRLYGDDVTVNLIDGVDTDTMVAVGLPGGSCSENDPDERRSAWSMAFPADAPQLSLQQAVCRVGDLSAAQRLANGCHLDGELFTCGVGPGFPPEVLDDLTVFPEATETYGADIGAMLGADDPDDLVGWRVIVEEETSGGYQQLLLREDPRSGELQYLVDGSDETFAVPRPCNPRPIG